MLFRAMTEIHSDATTTNIMTYSEDLERRFKNNPIKTIVDELLAAAEGIHALKNRLKLSEVLSQELANINGHSGPGRWTDVIECQLCPKIKAWKEAAEK